MKTKYYSLLNLGKFMVKKPDRLTLRRERIIKFLKENLAYKKLILINAPAGYGKTTLISQIMDEFKSIEFVYYNIDENDRNFVTFTSHITFGFRNIYGNFGSYILNLIQKTGEEEKIFRNLINEIIRKIKKEAILVLDNFHHIEKQRYASAFLNYFLNYTPPNIKIVISSREIPKMDIIEKFNFEGKVLYIPKSMLSFDKEEIRHLAAKFGIKLKEQELKKIKGLSDGWALYLNWFFRKIKEKNKEEFFPDVIKEVSVRREDLFKYIANEIFPGLKSRDIKLLLLYSLLEKRELSVVKKILKVKKPEEILNRIYLRVPYLFEERNGAFMLHPVFKKFLETKVKKRELNDIYSEIGKYYEKKNIVKAIEFYIKASNFERAILLFLKNRELLIRHKHLLIKFLLENIPEKYYKKYPILCYYKAMITIVWERKIREGEILINILDGLKFREKKVKTKYLRAVIHEQKGEIEKAIRICRELLKATKNKKFLKRCFIHLGICEAKKGNLEKAKKYFLKALKFSERERNILEEINIMTNLFTIELEYGNYEIYDRILNFWEKYHLLYPYQLMFLMMNVISLEIILKRINQAEKHAEWFFEKSLDTLNDVYIGVSYKFLGDIESLKGNFEEAERLLSKACQIAEEKDIGQLRYVVYSSFIEHYMRKRDVENLKKWISKMEEDFKKDFKINFYKGKLKLLENMHKEAKEYFESLANTSLKDNFLKTLNLLNLMFTEYQLNNYESAEKIYKEIKSIIHEKYPFLLKDMDNREKKIIETFEAKKISRGLVKEPHLLKVNFFGNLEIFYNFRRLKLHYRTEKCLSLFSFLLYKSQFYNPDILIEMYWSETELKKARNNLYVSISSINRQFEMLFGKKIIIRIKEGYGINPEIKIEKDVEKFEESINEAKVCELKGDINGFIQSLEKAKKFYRGDFLHNLYDFWVEEKRGYYKNLYLYILENLGKAYKKIHKHNEAAINFEELIKINPLREEIYRELIEIYKELKNFQKIKKIQEFYSNNL